MDEEIEPIPIIDNMSSHILKPKKEGRNPAEETRVQQEESRRTKGTSQV